MKKIVAHTKKEGGDWVEGTPYLGTWHTVLFDDGTAFDKTLCEAHVNNGIRKVRFMPKFVDGVPRPWTPEEIAAELEKDGDNA
jgi:hypothetical protein